MEVPHIDTNILPHTTAGPLGGEDAPIDSSLPEAVRLCNLHHLSNVPVALNQAYIWTSWGPVTNRNTHRQMQLIDSFSDGNYCLRQHRTFYQFCAEPIAIQRHRLVTPNLSKGVSNACCASP